MSGVIILASSEGIETPSETVDGGIEAKIVIIGEDDVKVPVQDSRSKVMEMSGDEGDADEVGLRALGRWS